MKLADFVTRKNLLALMLGIGAIQVALYYVAGTLASVDGGMAIPQPDTLLYCQAARRIVEGHPFSFSEGTAVCTGTTSVLYPFVLAVPYWLGATGDALFMAGFWLNAFFYLLFLAGWGLALWEWLEKPGTRLLAGLLIALAGQPAYCSLAQSDIGCWLAVSGFLAAGLARGSRPLYGSLLLLGPWIRPEGMICVLAFALVQTLQVLNLKFKLWPQTDRRELGKDLLLVGAGLLSLVGVFVLNYALTGEAQFSSVAHKGYFKQYSFPAAIYLTAGDFLTMLKDVVFGLSPRLPRSLYSIPLVGGICLLAGLAAYPWRTSRTRTASFATFLLAFFGGFLTVSYSSWQNTNLDRYICWGAPLLFLFIALGCQRLSEKMGPWTFHWLPSGVLVVFSFGSLLALCAAFHQASELVDPTRLFAQECEAALPSGASLGGHSHLGLAYLLSPRRFAHLSTIYSPEFARKAREPASVFSILKNQPDTRFDFWFIDHDQSTEFFGKHADALCGAAVKTGPEGWQLRKANWSGWDVAPSVQTNLHLVSRLSIAYERDEAACQYEAFDRYGRKPFHSFVQSERLDGVPVLECGRVLVGGDAFSVPLTPGKDARIVMRTLPRQTVSSGNGIKHTVETIEFANPLEVRIRVDGQDLGIQSVSYATNGFSDVTFTIPGSAITASPARIALLGDHITCGYWFYQ